ncbi:MAG: hypothetical protein ACKVQC_06745 [Elusimicrobiota bacterium]
MKKVIFFSFFFLISDLLFSQIENNLLSLRADPPGFSPNRDEVKEQVFFYPVFQGKDQPLRWRLDIRNSKGGRVARMSGPGVPALLKWEGLDRKDSVAIEGKYQAAFFVWTQKNNYNALVDFALDITAPEINIHSSSPVFTRSMVDGGGVKFNVSVKDASPIEKCQFQVMDMTGKTVYLKMMEGFSSEFEWDGKNSSTQVLVPSGKYRCAYQGWDVAGNVNDPVFIDVEVQVSPREMLEQVLKKIKIFVTPNGLLVQVPREQYFQIPNGKPEILSSADELMKELGIIVNAYPQAPIKLDGYSFSLKTVALDQDISSLFAWSVYSYLVKNENVTASRMSVRGRGRSPMFDRRAIDVPVIKNGVEIFIEEADGF